MTTPAQVSAEVLGDVKQMQYNSNATGGLTKWQLNVSVDVSNCVDILNTNVPRTEYDVYNATIKANAKGVSTDVLYTGLLRGTTAIARPAEPDYQNPY